MSAVKKEMHPADLAALNAKLAEIRANLPADYSVQDVNWLCVLIIAGWAGFFAAQQCYGLLWNPWLYLLCLGAFLGAQVATSVFARCVR